MAESNGSLQDVTSIGTPVPYTTAIPNTIISGKRSQGLTLPTRWLYVYLCSIADRQGERLCTQGTTALAAGAQLSRGAIVASKRELVQAGLITIESRDREQGQTDIIRLVDLSRENAEEYAAIQQLWV